MIKIKNSPFGYSILLLILLFVSCKPKEIFNRPDTANEIIYRTDLLPKDSANLANKSWKEIFTDPLLQGYIQKALDYNLDIRIAQQNIVAAESYLLQQKQTILPNLNIGPNFTFQTQSLNTQFGKLFGERTYIKQFDVTASLLWEYNLAGRIPSQTRAQQAAYLNTLAVHQSIKTDLVSAIASGYYQLLAFDEQKRILQNTIAVRNKNVEISKALKQAGILTEVAVQQSLALSINAEALQITLDNQITLLENALSILLGENPQGIKRSSLAQQNLPEEFKIGFPAQLLANRPDVMASELDMIQAFELKNAAKASFYPSLRISANTGLQSIELDKLFSVNSIFGNVVSGLVQPILNKRQIKTQYEITLVNQEKAYLNFKKTLLNASRQVSDAMSTYNNQKQFISLKNKELEAYKKAVTYSEELVKHGMANYLEVLNASVNALNAELNIVNAEYTQMKALVDVYKALGGGWK